MPIQYLKDSKKRYVQGGYWKNGKLILFKNNEILVMRPWGEKAGAWVKNDAGWKGVRPEESVLENHLLPNDWYADKIPASFLKSLPDIDPEQPLQYVIPPDMDAQTSAWVKHYYRQLGRWCAMEQFLKQIPDWALQRARLLRTRQWHMLQFFNRVPGAKDLFDSTPALAYMLASCNAFHPTRNRFRTSRLKIKKTQKEIAGWLGFPPTQSTINILRKIQMDDLFMNLCFNLRRAVNDKNIHQALCHVESITQGLLRVIHLNLNLDFLVRIMTTRKYLDYNYVDYLAKLHYDTRRMNETLHGTLTLDATKITSLKALKKMHDGLVRENIAKSTRQLEWEFPDAPIDPDTHIHPINSIEQLQAESTAMHNCIFSYGDLIASGRYYLYSMTEPQKCTVGIYKSGSEWKLDDVKLVNNLAPKRSTVRRVKKWLVNAKENLDTNRPLCGATLSAPGRSVTDVFPEWPPF